MPDLPHIDGLTSHFDAAKLDLPDGAPVNCHPTARFAGLTSWTGHGNVYGDAVAKPGHEPSVRHVAADEQ